MYIEFNPLFRPCLLIIVIALNGASLTLSYDRTLLQNDLVVKIGSKATN